MAFISERQLQAARIDLAEVDEGDEVQVEKYARLFAGNMRDTFNDTDFKKVPAAIEILMPGLSVLIEGADPVVDDKLIKKLLKASGVGAAEPLKTALSEYRSNAEMLLENYHSVHQCAEGGPDEMEWGFGLDTFPQQVRSMNTLFGLALQHAKPPRGKPLLDAAALTTIREAQAATQGMLETMQDQRDFAAGLARFIKVTGRSTDEEGALPSADIRRILGIGEQRNEPERE